MNNVLCPCCSAELFSECCQPFITKALKPKTAEQLMRSRFTAFTLKKHQYLLDTHRSNARSENELSELENSQRSTTWIKLVIHYTKNGQSNDTDGIVEFSAFFHEDNQFFELQEISNFTQENAQWLYLNGDTHLKETNIKFKRNEPCWCQSGKKLKHCHST